MDANGTPLPSCAVAAMAPALPVKENIITATPKAGSLYVLDACHRQGKHFSDALCDGPWNTPGMTAAWFFTAAAPAFHGGRAPAGGSGPRRAPEDFAPLAKSAPPVFHSAFRRPGAEMSLQQLYQGYGGRWRCGRNACGLSGGWRYALPWHALITGQDGGTYPRRPTVRTVALIAPKIILPPTRTFAFLIYIANPYPG